MTLSRDELAARFAVVAYGAPDVGEITQDDLAKHAVTMADALLAALASKRPEWVRITGPKGTANVTIGKVYEVTGFDDDRDRLIIKNDDGWEWGLSNKPGESSAFPTWEPCAPPATDAPVDPVREAERAVVEAAEAYCYGSSNYLRLLSATDALRAARKAKGGAS